MNEKKIIDGALKKHWSSITYHNLGNLQFRDFHSQQSYSRIFSAFMYAIRKARQEQIATLRREMESDRKLTLETFNLLPEHGQIEASIKRIINKIYDEVLFIIEKTEEGE
jgi:hypothetical protein